MSNRARSTLSHGEVHGFQERLDSTIDRACHQKQRASKIWKLSLQIRISTCPRVKTLRKVRIAFCMCQTTVPLADVCSATCVKWEGCSTEWRLQWPISATQDGQAATACLWNLWAILCKTGTLEKARAITHQREAFRMPGVYKMFCSEGPFTPASAKAACNRRHIVSPS